MLLLEDMYGIEEDPESLKFDFDPNYPYESLLLLLSSSLWLFDPKLLLSLQNTVVFLFLSPDLNF